MRKAIQFVCCAVAVITTFAVCNVDARAQQRALVPETFALDEVAREALNADWLTAAERRRKRIFHGVWDQRDLVTPTNRATVALNAWRVNDPIFEDEHTPAELVAEAHLNAGRAESAIERLHNTSSIRAQRIKAEALWTLGRFDDANNAIDSIATQLRFEKTEDPAALTEGVRALILRARIEGEPASGFQNMMSLLGRAHQQLDRLYWPATLIEAQLLSEKDNMREAAEALHKTLSLNPRCAPAWYELGRLALKQFDFDSAATASASLRRLNDNHPLAAMLDAESRMIQDDPEGALDVIKPVLKRLPKQRRALALKAAAHAVHFDDDAMHKALDRYDELSPGSAQAYYVVGRHLSFNRQYEVAAKILEQAIDREPNWPKPQIELGLMYMQAARDQRAHEVLEQATELDPFNRRAANTLHLIEEFDSYEKLHTEHFIIRYKPGIDEVLVDLMPPVLERIHDTVVERFQFEPDRKTIIEVLPDHERFAVRITGRPDIYTIAAATGPVIALEVPREGPKKKHQGLFDWPRVIQHEYTHTVTLAQTENRIPHWLTEAAAVDMERAPRDYNTSQLLATTYRDGELFDMDNINWGFVRPEKPTDRPLAYAQAHWMIQYMTEQYGSDALIRLLMQYLQGKNQQQAMLSAIGQSPEDFYHAFLKWAGKQIKQWGLDPEPSMLALTDRLRMNDPELKAKMQQSQQARLDVIVQTITGQIGRPARRTGKKMTAEHWPDLVRPSVTIDDEQMAKWLEQYPKHPDLLELKVRRALEDNAGEADASMSPLLKAYAQARPVDPLPYKKLAQIYLDSDDSSRAIEPLEFLDAREQRSPVYALQLARLYRENGRYDKALQKARRAVNIDPYDAPNRELAAAIAIQSNELREARTHIKALTLLEPDQSRHQKRLDAIDRMIDRSSDT